MMAMQKRQRLPLPYHDALGLSSGGVTQVVDMATTQWLLPLRVAQRVFFYEE